MTNEKNFNYGLIHNLFQFQAQCLLASSVHFWLTMTGKDTSWAKYRFCNSNEQIPRTRPKTLSTTRIKKCIVILMYVPCILYSLLTRPTNAHTYTHTYIYKQYFVYRKYSYMFRCIHIIYRESYDFYNFSKVKG